MRALRVNQKTEVVSAQTSNELKITRKLHKAERSCSFLPDDPPAIQQFVNDLNGFTELQRDLVPLLRLVGFGGDVQFSCRDTQHYYKDTLGKNANPFNEENVNSLPS